MGAVAEAAPIPNLSTGRPGLDVEALHREVSRIAGGEPGPGRNCRGGDQAVGLTQRYPSSGELPPPCSRPDALLSRDRQHDQAVEQGLGGCPLSRPQPANYLFDVDAGGGEHLAARGQRFQAVADGPAPQVVDQDRGIEEDHPTRRRSPRRCARTQAAGSSSQSCPRSGIAPRAESMSSRRSACSRAAATASRTKRLRPRFPATSSIRPRSSSSMSMCTRMCRR